MLSHEPIIVTGQKTQSYFFVNCFGEDPSYVEVQTEFHIISSLNFIEITV
jgi:hypothetical protein